MHPNVAARPPLPSVVVMEAPFGEGTMRTREIKNVAELLHVLADWKGKQSIFRGVSSVAHTLKPSIGRCPVPENTTRAKMERRLFRQFKDRSLPHLAFAPRDDWEWLAVAQHFGLPTRLLDWSTNPLVAAYFAVEQERDTDGAIYVCEMKKVADRTKAPLEEKDVVRFQPPAITERIVRQAGLFTVHPDPDNDFEPEDVWKLTIPKANRRDMKRELFKLGFSRGALFRGLDGTAADSTWEGSGIY